MVMSIKDSYVVLLDENGNFVYGANRGYTIGQTVDDPWIMKDHKVKPLHYFKPIVITVGALAMMLLLTIGIHVYTTTIRVIASVYLSINPSVRLDINAYGNVVSLEGTNEDGKALIAGYNPAHKDQYEVSDDLMDRAIEMGYLSDGDTIVIRVDAANEATFVDLGIGYRSHLDDYFENNLDVTIEVMDADYREPVVQPTPTVIPTSVPTPEPTIVPEPTALPSTPVMTQQPVIVEQQSDYGQSDYGDSTSNYDDSTSDYDD